MAQPLYRRPSSGRFLVERMPDGSAAVFDTASEAVHSLNQTALVVWDACAEPASIDDLAEALQRATGVADGHTAAEHALTQLQAAGLVELVPDAAGISASRRRALVIIGGSSMAFVAPLVISMALSEQRLL